MSVVTAIVVAVLCTTLGLVALVLTSSVAEIRADAQRLFFEVAEHVRQRLKGQIDELVQLASLGSAVPGADAAVDGDGTSHPLMPFLERAVADRPSVYSVYYGWEDGSFLQAIDARGDPRVLAALQAPGGTALATRSIDSAHGRRLEHRRFLGTNGQLLDSRENPEPAYDPRLRPWYQGALAGEAPLLTEPYLFASLGVPGLTASRRTPDSRGAFGVDLNLDGRGRLLAASATMTRFLGAHNPLDPLEGRGIRIIDGSEPTGSGELMTYRGGWTDEHGHSIRIIVAAPQEDLAGYLASLRVRAIARQTWVRHFDDRLGLSWEEAERYGTVAPRSPPCQEQLLADRPEHLLSRGEGFYRSYEGHGFSLPVPKSLYNLGEVYNLCIARGTLNAEERFKINEHIMQTIVMLERLPLPQSLKRVPQYAGTHHETLRGTGYPRGSGADSMSIPERIMVIADIFEALTASDRPYRRPKKLSECVAILHDFKKRGDIDPDLFDLFLESGAYQRYAEEHLKPDQIDVVDVGPYLHESGRSLSPSL